MKLYFNSKNINSKIDTTETDKKMSEEIYVRDSKLELSILAQNILLDEENENEGKNPYIRRYLECLTELYKDNNYSHIINIRKYYNGLLNKNYEDNFFYSLFKKESEIEELTNTPIEDLEGDDYDYVARDSFIPEYKRKLDEIDNKLSNYQEAIDFFFKNHCSISKNRMG